MLHLDSYVSPSVGRLSCSKLHCADLLPQGRQQRTLRIDAYARVKQLQRDCKYTTAAFHQNDVYLKPFNER